MYDCACISTKRQLPHMGTGRQRTGKVGRQRTTRLDRTNYVPAERLRPALI